MRRKGRRFPRVSEEMKAWSAALGGELETWPQCRLRPFFGFHAAYRGQKIFGLLPWTRGLEPLNSVGFKLESAGPRILGLARSDPRMTFREMQKKRWFMFTVSSNADLGEALEWFSRAYDAAS